MNKRKLSDVVICWALMSVVYRNAEAGPMKRLSRMVREVYPEIEPENEGNQAQVCIVGDLVYGADEPVPADQPCLKCRCLPPGVQCETIQCAKRPGCKAIHKSNKCCPDYQCECEHNGKFYANGEKLETPPGGECKVCYCRGGEVQCAEVSCYIRKDCEGKRVPGKCCPKYDHCPPIDPIPEKIDNFEPWPFTGVLPNVTESILNPTSNDIQDENRIPDTNDYEVTTASNKAIEVDDLQKEADIVLPRITIQEIIPERKEIPITAPPKTGIEPQGTLIIEEADEFLNHSNDLVVTDSDTDSSEISEIYQQPPPVLRVGDKLLFLKKGEFVSDNNTSTPNTVITIIGAEGLQRGFEDSGEIHEVNIETNPKETFVGNTSKSEDAEDTETNDSNGNKEPKETNDNSRNEDVDINSDKEINLTELNTAESTHILSLVKRKNKPTSTTTTQASVPTTEFQIVSSTSTENNAEQETSTNAITTQEAVIKTLSSSTESLNNTSEILDSSTEIPVTTENCETTVKIPQDVAFDNIPTEESSSLTDRAVITEITETENNTESKVEISSNVTEDILIEQNPAYPPLAEIIPDTEDNSQRFYVDNTEKTLGNDVPVPSPKILPEVLEIRSNKTVPRNSSHSEWLKSNIDASASSTTSPLADVPVNPTPTNFEETTENVSSTRIEDITSEGMTTEQISSEDFSTVTNEALTTEIDTEGIKELTTTTDGSVKIEETERSVETVEDSNEDSGESTTPKDSHASLISNENASIESLVRDISEAGDMVSTKHVADNNSGEQTTTNPELNDSGLIDNGNSPKNNNTNEEKSKDVEIIDATIFQKQKPIQKTISVEETTTIEVSLKPQRLTQLPSKTIGKRENTPEEEAEEIIKELEKELSADKIENSLTIEEEIKETEITTKSQEYSSISTKYTEDNREVETESIESIKAPTPKEKQTTGFLEILANFFSSQSKR